MRPAAHTRQRARPICLRGGVLPGKWAARLPRRVPSAAQACLLVEDLAQLRDVRYFQRVKVGYLDEMHGPEAA